jgi:hypothetical protein
VKSVLLRSVAVAVFLKMLWLSSFRNSVKAFSVKLL